MRFLILIITIIFILNSSCSHYSVVTTDKTPFRTIFIDLPLNDSFAPNIHVQFYHQIVESIMNNTPLEISSDINKSDVKLNIILTEYKRGSSSRSSSDPGRFNAINLSLEANVSLYDINNNIYLLENDIIVESMPIYFDQESVLDNSREVEYQKLPTLSRKLSETIVNRITNHW